MPMALAARLKPSLSSSIPADCRLPVSYSTGATDAYQIWNQRSIQSLWNESNEQWSSLFRRVEVSGEVEGSGDPNWIVY